jgi:stress-induced morphogen
MHSLQRGPQHQAACRGIAVRMSTTSAGDSSAQREEEIADLLRSRMPGAHAVRVLDTSGGCGSMYRIEIAADEFR